MMFVFSGMYLADTPGKFIVGVVSYGSGCGHTTS